MLNDGDEILIWLDPNLKIDADYSHAMISKLQNLTNNFLLHFNPVQSINYMQSVINKKIFLVVAVVFVEQVLSSVNLLKSLDSIYILRSNEQEYQCLKENSRIVGVYSDLRSLKNDLKKNIRLMRRQAVTIRFFNQNQRSTRDLTKDTVLFLWFQILRTVGKKIAHLHSEQAKELMLDVCRHYYRNNEAELKKIEKFKNTYKSNDAIQWYTKGSFIYRLINQILRTENLQSLFMFGFYIIDLSAQLHQLRKQQPKIFDTLYRGQTMGKDEFGKIQDNVGSLISVNTFFSTTKDIEIASLFMERLPHEIETGEMVSVLFDIKIDPVGSKTIFFADIEQYSAIPDEKEVLFDIASVFRINNVTYDNRKNCWIIHMATTDDGSIKLKDYKKNLAQELENNSPVILLGSLLNDIGYANTAENYFHFLLKTLPRDNADLGDIYHNLGRAVRAQGHFRQAIDYYRFAHQIRTTRGDHFGIAKSLIGLGYMNFVLGYFDRAVHDYEQAIDILTKLFSSLDHTLIGLALSNIGSIHHARGQYDLALNYFQKHLRILQRLFPKGHNYMRTPLAKIADVFWSKQRFQLAIQYYYRAVSICEHFLPHDNPEKVGLCSNIARLSSILGDEGTALNMYEKILSVQQDIYQPDDPRINQTRSHIKCLRSQLKYYP